MVVDSTQQIFAASAHNSVNVNSKCKVKAFLIFENQSSFADATDSKNQCFNIRDQFYSLVYVMLIIKILILATNESLMYSYYFCTHIYSIR